MDAFSVTACADILLSHEGREGALLPILHDVQAAFGYVPDAAIPQIAEWLNVSRAEVFGVVTFYHDFRRHPPGAHVVKMCRAEACQSVGGREVAQEALRALGVDWHGTTPDGRITLEPVYCLGLCACGPAALVDGEPMGKLSVAGMAPMLEAMR